MCLFVCWCSVWYMWLRDVLVVVVGGCVGLFVVCVGVWCSVFCVVCFVVVLLYSVCWLYWV